MVPSKVGILSRLNPGFQDCSDAGIVVCAQFGNLRIFLRSLILREISFHEIPKPVDKSKVYDFAIPIFC